MREVQTKFPNGKVVRDRYMIEGLLGKGGFSAVYRVRDRRVKGNVFALKELVSPDKQQRECFTFECEILKRLDHPALPRVYLMFEDSKYDRIYMLMDYVDGSNLDRLRQRQPEKHFPFSRIMEIMAPIVDAIIYLHTQNPPVIHRDIKPSNIIVPVSGDNAILIDFGIAKEYDKDATTRVVRHCSPGYGAPEQYAGDTDTHTDIYALGATFYTLLTGEVPVDALQRVTRLGGRYQDPLVRADVKVPTLPTAVADAIQRAMEINSGDRFATIKEFWQALSEALPSEPVPPEPVPANVNAPSTYSVAIIKDEARTGLPIKRKRLLWIPLVALVLIALLSTIVFSVKFRTEDSTARHAVRNTRNTVTVSHSPIVRSAPTAITPQPTPTATTAPSKYPNLVAQYSGTIIDKFTNPATTSNMSLAQLHRDGMQISGYFSVGPGLVGNGSFNGTITTDSKLQFLIPSDGPLLPLFFQGQVQSDGSIAGTYCSYQNNQCNYAAGGYGDWHVTPS